MSINKFGTSLERGGAGSYYQWSGLVRNYVRDNALCMVTTDFDAKSRKIRRVAQPVDDSDAANKRYVQQTVKILKDRQNEIERKIETLQSRVKITTHMLNEFQRQLDALTHRAE